MYTKLKKYSASNGYPTENWKPVECPCGQDQLSLFTDDDEGGAFASCKNCGNDIDLLGSKKYAESAVLNICNCDEENLNIVIGQAFYPATDEASWSYIGAICPSCGLEGVYADWKER